MACAVQIASYEAEEERKRKERNEAAASEGWTVVKRHKVCLRALRSLVHGACRGIRRKLLEPLDSFAGVLLSLVLTLYYMSWQGRHGDTAVGGVAAARAAELGAAAQKKERGAAEFYRAQKKEKERDRLMQLRQGFAEDQKRVHELRAARRFKPS